MGKYFRKNIKLNYCMSNGGKVKLIHKNNFNLKGMKKLEKNCFFNLFRNFSDLIFSMLIFSYVSRVLNPSGLGKITFYSSISAYFLMFSSLGIPLYGIREVAKVRDDKFKLEKIVSEILLINFLTTTFIMLIYFVLLNIGILGYEKELLVIMSLGIIFSFVGVEWFFQGLEEYEYIAIRSVICRLLSLILIYIFVKNEDDYIKYALIIVLISILLSFNNFIKLNKTIKISFKNINIKKHWKPIFVIFSLNLTMSIYTNLDNIMLGYKSTEIAVGYYSAGIKLVKSVLAISTSLSVVMLPRISNYISNDSEKELNELLNKSFKIIFLFALPCFLGLYMTTKEIILIFSGTNFTEAIKTMKYLSPIIIFITFSNFMTIQIFYPRSEEKKVLISLTIGAITNFILNWFLIPIYQQNGAAISTTIAEGIVILFQIILGYKYFKVIDLNNEFFKIILSNIIMLGILILVSRLSIINIYFSLIFKVSLGSFVYLISLVILKEEFIYRIIRKV